MKNRTTYTLAIALGLVLGGTLQAADLGMEAPPLEVAQWVKGGPVQFTPGKGTNWYVVEFWATWCPPCRESIPHLTEIQKRFKDRGLIVIGVTDEEAGKVKPFVEKMGDKMAYAVAIDKENQSSERYMKAFGQNGIPHAFVVDRQGKIAWHGHPMAGLDSALDQMAAGKYDLEAARRQSKARDQMIQYFEMASEATLPPEAIKLGTEVVEGLGSDPQSLNSFAWVILTHPQIKHRDLTLALRAARAAYETTAGKDPAVTDTYARALFDTGKKDEAIKFQKEAIALCTDDAMRKELEQNLKNFESPAKPAQ